MRRGDSVPVPLNEGERYAGEIRAEPKEPHGTVFVVELPVCPGSPLPDADPEDSKARITQVLGQAQFA